MRHLLWVFSLAGMLTFGAPLMASDCDVCNSCNRCNACDISSEGNMGTEPLNWNQWGAGY